MVWLLLVAVIGLACWNVNLRRRLELVELGPTQEQIAAIVSVQRQDGKRILALEGCAKVAAASDTAGIQATVNGWAFSVREAQQAIHVMDTDIRNVQSGMESLRRRQTLIEAEREPLWAAILDRNEKRKAVKRRVSRKKR